MLCGLGDGVCDQQVVALSNIQGEGRCLWKEGTETVSHKLHSVVCSHYWSLPRAALHYPSLFTQTVETILAMAKGKQLVAIDRKTYVINCNTANKYTS